MHSTRYGTEANVHYSTADNNNHVAVHTQHVSLQIPKFHLVHCERTVLACKCLRTLENNMKAPICFHTELQHTDYIQCRTGCVYMYIIISSLGSVLTPLDYGCAVKVPTRIFLFGEILFGGLVPPYLIYEFYTSFAP